jgi:uncharacterized membrane protein
MEKRIIGLILTILGAIGLIYAGVVFIRSGVGNDNLRSILVAAVLGAIFFSAGIGLVRNTKDLPS